MLDGFLHLLLVLLSQLIDDFAADSFSLGDSLELLFQSLDLGDEPAALGVPIIAGVARNLFDRLLLFFQLLDLGVGVRSCAAGRLIPFDFFLSLDESLLELCSVVVQLAPLGLPSPRRGLQPFDFGLERLAFSGPLRRR